MESENTTPEPARRTSKLAVGALVLALLGWLSLICISVTEYTEIVLPIAIVISIGLLGMFCPPFGLVAGLAALIRISHSRGKQSGLRTAVAALVLSVAQLLVLAYAMSLSLDNIREGSYRTHCAENLRQIGLAIKQYAADNGGEFPSGFDPFYPDYLYAKILSCPSNPSDWHSICNESIIGDRDDVSYVYVSGLVATGQPECVVAYDRPGNHGEPGFNELFLGRAGVNVLFIDGRVEWMKLGKMEELLDRTRALARENGHEVRLLYE